LGQATETIGKIDTWPGSGLHPTSHWRVGEIFADTYALPIDVQAATPSLLRLNLKFWLEEPEAPLSVALPDGKPTNTVTLEMGRLISRQRFTPQPGTRLDTVFDYGIILLGVDVGEQGRFTLYWTITDPIAYDYTVFVHLLDAQGQQVTDADSPPLGHDWPTSAWIPNAPFADARQFKLPEHLLPGKYTLRLGLYDPLTGERLGAYQMDGTPWPDYAIILNHVIEIK
jgi:hypothetical protein